MKNWQDKAISVCSINAHQKRVCFKMVLAVVCYAWGALWPALVFAADQEYRGVSLKPLSGRYLVLKDVNVRAKPKTKSKRIGRLRAGDWVEAFGRPKDASWIAVKKDGKRFGFVVAPVLVPVINGRLDKPLKGKIKETHNIKCDYVIKFIGKSEAQGEVFKTSDYEVQFKCKKKDSAFSFLAPMFITEGPYQVSRKPHYQISIDLLQVDTKKYEEHFSTIIIYQHNKKRVVFDAISVKGLGGKPSEKTKKAKSVSGALTSAVEIAASAWGPKVWQALARTPILKKKE